MKHLIDINDLSERELEELIDKACDIIRNPQSYSEKCKGKKLATLFFEPSTRTRLSFEAAMYELGGNVLGFSDSMNSSSAKGESVADTAKTVSYYADIIAMRHPKEGAAYAASLYSRKPVINAGDGGHLHPTQTLTDLVTLSHEKGTLSGLTIGICGDIKNGRTVHSLVKCLSKYDNKFILISTPELQSPQYIKDILNASGCKYSFCNTLEEALPYLDVLYMTRIQQERFSSIEEYERQKGVYVLDRAKLSLAKKDLKILHPLPRVDEITNDVDDDPRAKYFQQAEYGMYARMALIMNMIEKGKDIIPPKVESTHSVCCSNPSCITAYERYLPHLFKGNGDMLVCKYCDDRILF